MQPGKPLPGIRSLMAVINSVGVGRGSKSVGEFTYRYTRGRTIASHRITKNTSKTPAQVGRRGAFGSFVWMFSPYKWFFSDGYEKTKHGSSFNQFVHVNRELLGKSPYNSEVNKKLIPNGKQLYTLISAIIGKSVPHLKYATYGTLNFVETSSFNSTSFISFLTSGTIYCDDFKGFSILINVVTNSGMTYTKEIPIYSDKEYPNFTVTYDWVKDYPVSIKVTSDLEKGTILFSAQGEAIIPYVMNLTQLPGSSIQAYSTIVIKQYGKIATIARILSANIDAKSQEETEEESSEHVQKDDTEIK